ncbi:MAG TPA: dethiobiotin synthase [Chloroflexota bacterium]|nr:dethiobiotin synthase [Chloroflexota bacterium]
MSVPAFDLGAPAVFVTGTDTGVGKTVVAGMLVAAARQCGVRVGVMKPVESGCRKFDGRPVPQDAVFLRELAGCRTPLDAVTPYALEHPLAPALAAEMEDVVIDVGRIVLGFRSLAAQYSCVVVEGAGGLLTPLAGGLTMRDLAAQLRVPVLIVARNTLGAINHASLTVESARAAGLEVLGIVLNRVGFEQDAATRTNAVSLRRWGRAHLIGEVPFLPSLDSGTLAMYGFHLAEQISIAWARAHPRDLRAQHAALRRRRRGERRA